MRQLDVVALGDLRVPGTSAAGAPWESKPCARSAVLEAYRQTWLRLQKRGTDTEQLVDIARQCWEGLCSGSAGLFTDRGFCLQVLEETAEAVEASLRRLRADRDSVCQALEDNLSVLEAAAEEPRRHEEILLNAARPQWERLWRAAWELRAGSELALEAVRQHWEALRLASCRSLADVELALASVRQRWSDQWLTSRELREDREAVLRTLMHTWDDACRALGRPGPSASEPASKELRRTWTALMLAADELLEDWEVARASVAESLRLLRQASELIRKGAKRGDVGGTSSCRFQTRLLWPPIRSQQPAVRMPRTPVPAGYWAGGIL